MIITLKWDLEGVERIFDKYFSLLILPTPAGGSEAFNCLPLDELGDRAKQFPESVKRYIYLSGDGGCLRDAFKISLLVLVEGGRAR